MRILRRRPGRALVPPAHDPDLAAAQQHATESARRADRDLARQQDMARREHGELVEPLRRLREVNHIAELIAESLTRQQSLHQGETQ